MTRLRQYAGLLAVLLLAAPALAQKVGTSSFQFLKVMPVARATALGDAYSTLASGAEAIFWNPAGMALVEGHDLSTTLTLWIFDTKQSALSYAASLGDWGTVGAQVQFVDYGKIEETRVDQLQFVGSGGDRRYNPGLTGSTFSPSITSSGRLVVKPCSQCCSTKRASGRRRMWPWSIRSLSHTPSHNVSNLLQRVTQ